MLLGGMHGRRAVALALTLMFFMPLTPAVSAEPAGVGLGMDTNSIGKAASFGAPSQYASYWVGAWSASGWGALDNALKTAKAAGATPVVYWYYWGDSISPTCVDYGCNGRSRAQWDSMTAGLAERVRVIMGGATTFIVLENEFNKKGIDGAYAPTFDVYLEAKANQLKGVAGVQVILGYGSWGEPAWGKFPKAIAASDMIGFQMMRGSTRDTEATYRASPDKIAAVLTHIKGMGGKAAFLYDLALSSYPDAHWEKVQGETMGAITARFPEYAASGLVGVVYRELFDNPHMDPANYFGYAEQHWGLRKSTGPKAAWYAWAAAAGASPPPPPAPASPNVPGSFEAEAMRATTGAREAVSSASGGAGWNLWANGALSTDLVSTGGSFAVSVVARGDPALGVAPRMELRVGGATVGAWDVPSGAYSTYSATVTLPNGTTPMTIAFTNDARTSTEDRNLHVDVVRLAVPPVNAAPAASFTWNATGLNVTVDASASTDADGDALEFTWDFGDGSAASGILATHSYASAGEQTITLTVSDGKASAIATSIVTVAVEESTPTASFTVAVRDLAVTVDASASGDADGDTLSFTWDFGDGSAASGNLATHSYAGPGEWSITLTVSDGDANVSTVRNVTTTPPNRAPVASFNASGARLDWSFDASSSSDPDGHALTYAWDFGDGTTGSGATAAHVYRASGSYSVILTVSDGKDSATTSRVVNATALFGAAFHPYDGNNWWVQVRVNATGGALASVCASVNGGACQALTLRTWGAWAASVNAPTGASVVFVATAKDGQSVRSDAYAWPYPPPTPFTAKFQPYGGNEWWLQTRVLNASETVKSVCASVNGGACKPLSLRDWGAWAASFNAPTGSKVVFTATGASGRTVASPAFTWPVK